MVERSREKIHRDPQEQGNAEDIDKQVLNQIKPVEDVYKTVVYDIETKLAQVEAEKKDLTQQLS